MHHVYSRSGVRVSFDSRGSGPPLVLLHGSFSDHRSNWEFVIDDLALHFSVIAVARRGRGETDATEGHALVDEADDALAVLASLGLPAFVLGHSYGAQVALSVAQRAPERVRGLVLYEPPTPRLVAGPTFARLEALAGNGDWGGFAWTFFADVLSVPIEELSALRASDSWASIVADAPASLGDLRALRRHAFDARAFARLTLPVRLQIGSESPRAFYVTDALAAALPDVRIEVLAGQAHEGMTTAPEQYVESVRRLLSPALSPA